MTVYNDRWFKNFVKQSDEKNLIFDKVIDIIKKLPHNSCLDIGAGSTRYNFSKKLAVLFNNYTIIEKKPYDNLPNNINFVKGDWETIKIHNKFDIILASHVIYYFKNKKNAFKKMFNSLKKNGKIIFITNGTSSDYGLLKRKFGKIIGTNYKFTYDFIINLLKNNEYKEYTIPSLIDFDTYETLYEAMRLYFDAYPNEYTLFKDDIIKYLKNNINNNKFSTNQKILVISNTN